MLGRGIEEEIRKHMREGRVWKECQMREVVIQFMMAAGSRCLRLRVAENCFRPRTTQLKYSEITGIVIPSHREKLLVLSEQSTCAESIE